MIQPYFIRKCTQNTHNWNLEKQMFTIIFSELSLDSVNFGPFLRGSLTKSMLITTFLQFWSQAQKQPCKEVGSLSLVELPEEFELGTFWF